MPDEPKPGEKIIVSKEVLLEKHDPPQTELIAKETILEKNAPSNIPPATTEEEDRTTASQRKVNLIWESTQAAIAIFITVTVCTVNAIRSLVPAAATIDNGASQILSNAFFLIVGFYFSRTNHTKTGGIGNTANKER